MPTTIEETENIIALNKPSGLIVHSDGRTEESSVADWVAHNFPGLSGIGGDWVSPQDMHVPLNGILHRLDRTTSGVLLVAKNQPTYEYFKQEFKARRVLKTYRVLVYGLMEGEGEVVAEIARSSVAPKQWYARPCAVDDRRAAITSWRVLKSRQDQGGEDVTYLEASPRTGRTHQIRVHLASIGHPVVADHLYASDRPSLFGFTRPALHAYSISITLHGNVKTFTAPLPEDFARSGFA